MEPFRWWPALALVGLFLPATATADWLDPDWQYRMPISLDAAQVEAALNDFPVLIDTRNEDAFVRDNLAARVAQAGGQDIVFTAADGTTVLPHEIEFFDDGDGRLVAWVSVPALDDAADTELYLYYGNAGSGDMQQRDQVWANGYRMVQHLQEPGDGNSVPTLVDSTGNGNNGSLLANQPPRRPTYLANSKIDGARRPIGERRSRIEVPHSGSLAISNEITVEAWARIENGQPAPDHNPIVWKGDRIGWGANYHFRIAVVGSQMTWGVTCGSDQVWEHNGSPAFDQWAHYALVLDRAANQLRGYINGQQVMSRSGCGGTALNTFSGEPVLSGWGERLSPTGEVHYRGGVDEMRISAGARPQAWLRTQYNNQNAPAGFHTFGPEEIDLDIALDPIYAFWYEEDQWDSVSGEVEDQSGNALHGRAFEGDTDDAEPAIDTDPGTCRYGDFSSGGRIVAPGSPLVNDADSFSIAAWVRTPHGDQTSSYPVLMAYGSTAGDNYAERFELYLDRDAFPEDWVFAVRKSNNGIRELRVEVDPYTDIDPLDDNWVHVIATYDAQSREAVLYLNGNEVGEDTLTGPQTLADATGDLGLFAHAGGAFDAVGFMDEPRVYAGALTDTEAQALYQETRPCGNQVAYYRIIHAGMGITCASNTVTIEAFDADNNPVEPSDGTLLTLSSDQGGGYWSTLLAGSGVFNAGADAVANYEFPGDESSVTAAYDYTAIPADPTSVVPTAGDGDGNGSVADPAELVMSRAGFRFIDSAGNASIPFQIAGKPSDTGYNADNLGLQAIRESDDDPTQCQGIYADGESAAVGLAAECQDPAVCGPETLAVNGVSIATNDDNGDGTSTTAYTDVTLNFGPNATAPISLEYFDVGALRLYAAAEIQRGDGTDSSDFMTGTSNAFTVRPFGFFVDSPALTSDPVGPNGPDTGVAGSNFDVTVSAVAWQAGDDNDNDGVPDQDADLSNNIVTPSFGAESQAIEVNLTPEVSAPSLAVGGNDGVLDNTLLAAFSNGSDNLTTNWSEVGYVDIVAQLDGVYLGSETVIGRGNDAGRFIPDHFTVTGNSPLLATACGTAFSYLRQPLNYANAPEVTIVPRNLAGQKTSNYDDFTGAGGDNWWKLGDITPGYEETAAGTGNLYIDSSGAIPTHSPGADAPSNAEVTITFNGPINHEFNTGAPEVDPFNSLPQLSFDVEDPEGVAYDDGSGGNTFELSIAFNQTNQIRHGRLHIGNAHGSELLDLAGVIHAESFGGSNVGWNREQADACTTGITLEANVVDGSGSACLYEAGGANQSGIGCGVDGGARNWAEPPTSGDFNAWFRATTNVGSHRIDAIVTPSWLQYDWDGDGTGHGEDPSGVITFGIYSGQDRQIDLREQ